MEKIYRGTSGAQYQIEEQRLAGGGEGSVFGIQGQPQFVAKFTRKTGGQANVNKSFVI